MNSCYSSTQVLFSSQKVSTLSGHSHAAYLLVMGWEFGVDSGNRQRLLPKGLTFSCNIRCTCNITLFVPWCGVKHTLPSMCDYCSADLHWVCQLVILATFNQNRSSTKFPSTLVPYEPRLTRESPLRDLETTNIISPAMLGQS